MEIGLLLKKLRNKKGIGIKTLASELDLNYTYISKLENGKVKPSEGTIKKIAGYYNYSYDELLLSANKIPDDIIEILRNNPQEALKYLRNKFGSTKLVDDE